ncbi:MAG: hypothetical protein S4CHLAM20_07860 [Chlamydiia bacterium]|nr:hypothetical protein [Chlamydiia bacterium]
MARSICKTHPSVTLAGHSGNWNFIFIPGSNLPEKTVLRFDMLTSDEEGSWQMPQAAPNVKLNCIWLTLADEKRMIPEAVDMGGYTVFDFVLNKAVKAGEELIITIGSIGKTAEKKNLAQTFTQRRRPFHLYIDTKGKKAFPKEPEVFYLDVKGGELNNIKIIGPSIVSRNDRFDLMLRFEDSYGNLTGYAPEDTLIELSYDQLRENLNWKLFIPETGYLSLPNLYFNDPGTYRIKLTNLQNKNVYQSPPIECVLSAEESLFWGILHAESKRHKTAEDVENSLRSFRDDNALQFYASSVFEDETSTPSADWKLLSSQIAQFNEEERFVSMLGFQWFGQPSVEGLRHFIYPKDNKPVLRMKDTKSNTLKKIYRSHSPKELLSIPCLTMAKGYSYNFKDFNPEFERVVEIFNYFGSSECSAKKGNPYPIRTKGRKSGMSETEEGSIQKALSKNCRFGFVSGGFDRRGVYKDTEQNDQIEYQNGLTGIFSKEYSRDNLFTSLYNRRCYATTGARIIVTFNIASMPMGSELDTHSKPGLEFNRHIEIKVSGTDKIKEIIVFRNLEKYKVLENLENEFECIIDDSDPLSKVVLKASGDSPDFTYYYLRITQEDGHIAYVTPIWVDYIPPKPAGKKSKSK